jgi:hypothetical protein
MTLARPSIEVAVIMQRIPTTGPASRWQPWRWELAEVVQWLRRLPMNIT